MTRRTITSNSSALAEKIQESGLVLLFVVPTPINLILDLPLWRVLQFYSTVCSSNPGDSVQLVEKDKLTKGESKENKTWRRGKPW